LPAICCDWSELLGYGRRVELVLLMCDGDAA
jgi:hypothetical protein